MLSKAIVNSGFVNLDDIRIQKIQTGYLDDSTIINGMYIEDSLKGCIKNAKGNVAIFNTSLYIERTETKGTLMFENAEDMLKFSVDESKSVKHLVDSICENTQVVLFNGNVNE